MYQKIRHKMKTGDVIAFSGKGHFSNIIKGYTDSDISHVGIVYSAHNIRGKQRIKIMESTTLNSIADCDTGEFVKGVQKQFLSDRLASYDGQAYWYKLKPALDSKRQLFMLQWLSDKHGKKVPYDTLQAIGSAADKLDFLGFENEPDFSSLFCSELVCKGLQIAGVVDENINPSEQTPADVVSYSILDDRVQIG